jgi:hypothetical protein
MRWDKENQLCAAQAFTGAATVSENSYQKQSAAQDISIGRRMALLCIVTTAAGAGSTHDMDCVQADNTALTTNLAVVASVDGILAATLVAGYVFEIPIPMGSLDQLHIGFQNTSTGGTTTVSLDVYLVPQDEIPKYKSFPRGSNIASV